MELIRANAADAQELWEMQVGAFAGYPEKYKDYDIDPACEKLERIAQRLTDGSFYYFICVSGEKVGAIRVVNSEDTKRISPVFILQNYRGKGYAQEAIKLAETIHGEHGWELETILQESANCHLYEKMGYKRTGRTDRVNEHMDLVYYKKD